MRLTAYLPASVVQRRDPAPYRSQAPNFWAVGEAAPLGSRQRRTANVRRPPRRRPSERLSWAGTSRLLDHRPARRRAGRRVRTYLMGARMD
jgi:hypothetical protein